MQYLSAELFRITQQREHMRKLEEVSANSEIRAKRLIELEEERAKREVERYEKEMELLQLKINYWKRKQQEDDIN